VAEYCGFTAILDFLIDHNLHGQKCTIYGDSKLVIEQMNGNWRIKKGHYKPIALEAMELLERFIVKPKLQWIPRGQNGIADELFKAELKKAGVEFRIQPES
jgi:ribonuclease HI